MFKHTHVQIINNVNNHFVCQPHSLLFECMMQVKKDINKPNEVSSSCSKNHFGRLIVNYTRKCASLETPSPSGNSCLYLTCLILASSLYLRVITVRGGGGGGRETNFPDVQNARALNYVRGTGKARGYVTCYHDTSQLHG